MNSVIYSLIAGAASLLGTCIVLKKKEAAVENSIFIISFAAGVMLSIAFLDIIPESLALCSPALMYVFAGFLALYVLQHIMMFHAGHDETHHASSIGTVSAVGLTFHSLLDGIVIAVGFEASPALGFMTTLAVLLHKLPEGITVSGILLHTHADRKRILTFAFVIAAATPVGAALARIFLMHVTKSILGALLAFTAGSFIYLAASDLLPETHRAHRRLNGVFFFFGVAVIAIVTKLL